MSLVTKKQHDYNSFQALQTVTEALVAFLKAQTEMGNHVSFLVTQ